MSRRGARCGGGMPARTVGGRYPEPFPLCRVCLPLSAFARTGSFVAGGRNVPGTRSSRTVPPARGGARIPCAGRALAGHLLPENNLSDWAGLTPEGRLAAFRPNLAAELCFARRWSVMASAAYSGWKGGKEHRFWGVSGISLEPRLWLRGDGRYRRFYLGVYGQLGDFDYQPSPSGDAGATGASRTGCYWHTGLSFGVYLPLSRHWGIEAGIRGGYRNASAKAYDNEPPHAYYHHDASSVRWGLTGINVGVGYRF
ncbi:DUF3575 domain-containing protein [Bacteroides fragilis]|nr:DUF3575 domain-containing protein [Bacteroides fragilis]